MLQDKGFTLLYSFLFSKHFHCQDTPLFLLKRRFSLIKVALSPKKSFHSSNQKFSPFKLQVSLKKDSFHTSRYSFHSLKDKCSSFKTQFSFIKIQFAMLKRCFQSSKTVFTPRHSFHSLKDKLFILPLQFSLNKKISQVVLSPLNNTIITLGTVPIAGDMQ